MPQKKYLNPAEYYEDRPTDLLPLLYTLHDVLADCDPHIRVAMKYNTPFFVRKSWVCYIGKNSSGVGVEICFARGSQLSNEHGLLRLEGRQSIQGILFKDVADYHAKEEAFLETLQEALLLDEISPRSAVADLLAGSKTRKK
jgi:hypothetical protein